MVFLVYQDSYGFIWLGIWDGFNCFDGYVFEVFCWQFVDSIFLVNNVINDIIGDFFGNIWIVMQGGVSWYLINQLGFLNYIFYNFVQQEICCFWIDFYYQFWAGINDGFFCYNLVMDVFEQFDNFLAKVVGECYVIKIFIDWQDRLWVGIISGLFCQLLDQ